MTVEVHIGPRDSPTLLQYLASKRDVTFVMGPLGSGKTTASILKLMLIAQAQAPNAEGVRPTRFYIVRNTYRDLASTTMKDFGEVFKAPEMGRWVRSGIEPPTFYGDWLAPDGTIVKSEFVFIALDRPDDVQKLRGSQVTAFWFNEAKELSKAIIDLADSRHGRYPSEALGGVLCTWHGMIGDTNAPDEDHWYYTLAEETRPEGWLFLRQPGGVIADGTHEDGSKRWVSNPQAENLTVLQKMYPDDYYLRLLRGKTDDWIRVNLANEYGFVADGKPVHPYYADSVHCLREAPEVMDAPLYIGVDFGRTPAATICQLSEGVHRWTCIDELGSEDMSAQTFAPELKAYLEREYPGLPVRPWGDPAGSAKGQATDDTPIRIMRASGIPIRPAPTNSPVARRAAIAQPLRRLCVDGRPALMISPKAKMTRKGLMGGFQYRRLAIVRRERYTDLPEKNSYSHYVESLEYVLLAEGEYHTALKTAPKRPGARRRRARFARH